jgi:condensin subunit Smc
MEKNEIIEILNSRANTKGKAQRFDAMMEQLDIRKAGISQRMLSLKTQEEEQQSAITQAKKSTIQSPNPFRPSGKKEVTSQKRSKPSRKP